MGGGHRGISPKLTMAVPVETVAAVDAIASRQGKRRAEFLRDVVDDALLRDAVELIKRTRSAQGLPETVVDSDVLVVVGRVLRRAGDRR